MTMRKTYVFADEYKVSLAAMKRMERLGLMINTPNDKVNIDRVAEAPKMKHIETIMKEDFNKKLSYTWTSCKKITLRDTTQNRLRFRGEWYCKLWDEQEPDVAYAAGFYQQMLKRAGKAMELDMRDLCQNKTLSKSIADSAFTYGEEFSVRWRFLAHIDRLADYKDAVDVEEFIPTGKYWNQTKYHTYPDEDGELTEEKFFQVFEEEANALFSGLNLNTETPVVIDPETWITNRANWANSGSGYLGELRPELTNKDLKRTKWFDAWLLDDDTLLRNFSTCTIAMNKVMQKTEVGKIRAIVGSDVWTYTRMKYISDNCLDYFFNKTSFSPLFMNNEERVKMWRRLCTISGWRMPLDQTEFDQMQTKKCILLVIRLLKEHFSWILGKYAYFFDLVYTGLDMGKVLCIDNEGNIVWVEDYKNGVMSGWYWTAFMDTVLNLITSRMAKRLVEEQTLVQVDMSMFYCQGDDDAFEFSTYLTCVLMYHAYIIMGYKVNRKKFYISNTRDEFLRKSFTPNKVSGYPARSVANILFASPERTNNNDEDVASARLSVWWRFSNRLGCKVERLPLVQDIEKATRLTTSEVKNWLYTPKELGGGGLDMTYSYLMNVTRIKRELTDKKKKNLFGLPGWKQFKSKFRISDDKLLDSTTQSKKGVNSKHVVTKVGNIVCYSVPLSLTIHEVANYKSQSIPRYEWEPYLGTIGRYSEIEPVNKDQIDTLISGFTRKLKEEFSEGLSLKGKLVQGLSEECTSFFANQYLPQVFQRLTLNHRSTLVDLQMMNLRVNKTALENLDFQWEE